mmetsp:Transcript_11727/g.5870  ORF Transcript_11727/g.5870 Transcript_11727/m.5870 type:complete len:263 (+) Transcript_11727:3714-4502(+)
MLNFLGKMNMVINYTDHKAVYWDKISCSVSSLNLSLIAEELLFIIVNSKPYSVIMRTPGDEIQHVTGFCVTEGIVDTPDDIYSLAFCDKNTNKVEVILTRSRTDKILQTFSQFENFKKNILAISDNDLEIDIVKAHQFLQKLSDYQPIRGITRSTHAAVIFNKDYELLSVAEDVGRHNTIDKAIGKLFLNYTLEKAAFIVLSSRVSYAIVCKVASAKISVIIALSRPTMRAIELAQKLNMTVITLGKDEGIYIFCGKRRVIF